MKINIKGVLKGTIFALIVTFVIIMILSLLSYFTSIGENILVIGVYAAVVIGVLLGSLAVSKAAQEKKLIHAVLVAFIYMCILIGVSFMINGNIAFNSHFFSIIAGIFAAGFAGSLIGN